MVLCHSMNAGSVVGYHEVVGTLMSYHMQKNLFEYFALTGGETQKNFGHKCSGTSVLLVPEPLCETFTKHFFLLTDVFVNRSNTNLTFLYKISIEVS